MFAWILKKIVGNKNQRELRRMLPTVKKINEFDAALESAPDDALRAKTLAWKDRLSKISDSAELARELDAILPEAFAVVKNAARRLCGKSFEVCGHPLVWNMVHFDVQLLGGMVLHKGRIAEMATGEGKTLVATLAVYLNALSGRGVHVVTVNDYLARRDAEWMGQLYKFLGLTVGVLQNDQPPAFRREQYACDITYGTNSEFGFDYLRDNGMATSRDQQVQRGHYFAIASLVVAEVLRELVNSATDLTGEKPMLVIQSQGIPYADVLVKDIMTPRDKLEVLCMDDVGKAAVGQVVATLQKQGRQHALVAERRSGQGQVLRGMFSASQISRQLGVSVQPHPLASTFAEIGAHLND